MKLLPRVLTLFLLSVPLVFDAAAAGSSRKKPAPSPKKPAATAPARKTPAKPDVPEQTTDADADAKAAEAEKAAPKPAPEPRSPDKPANPTVSTLESGEIADFEHAAPAVRSMLTYALEMTKRHIGYRMGSADPGAGFMDCSGTVYHILQRTGLHETPRQADELYRWLWQAGTFHAVNGRSWQSFEFSRLQPGDLLFWTGTYNVEERDPPLSHVMIYLGRAKSDGRPLMIGASDGRSFRGNPQCGVSVFDFTLPSEKSAAHFVGYGAVPGLATTVSLANVNNRPPAPIPPATGAAAAKPADSATEPGDATDSEAGATPPATKPSAKPATSKPEPKKSGKASGKR